ncbi:transmembrane protein [Tripterygium wilfordii]|uniref:Transmembrane protein n=1 Tax=Tripterygium wilfordii TaxID=458696 RepID=A0A7J7C331_TRIWF|nr:transmembrane protein [Tripterygium wilfordii]
MNPGQLALLRSTICVVLTTHFSVQVMSKHLLCWKKAEEQKAILLIVLKAPIYAVDSYAGLLDLRGRKAFFMFLESIKESCEELVRLLDQDGHNLCSSV